ncbi:hypothetical protein FCH28_01200 [Streptomyces piniterrae]|uniref:FtsK domain-containing protein n=1 Tax=Streptomyces piniterrae TaxID=2571125 RepID=A0A4V5MMR6_9ACTN|nr:hypothetical protein [Streptomyces piniterrae]TJZ58808.1 hypothetical protein FCH28_01200 [Streptomyces piniterrae]
MARHSLPRILTDSTRLARTAADGATDVLHPLITIGRGLRRLVAAGRERWSETPKERRGPLFFSVAACVLVVALVPYGPLLALISVMGVAAWAGRDRAEAAEAEVPDEAETGRLQTLYEALVPYFSAGADPSPLYAHDGDWEQVFTEYAFDDSARLERLRLKYPAYFTDGEPQSRARIEQLLHVKCGRGREYHFAWDEEANELVLSVLAALPTDIAAQPFITSPGETVLGFTDPDSVARTVPVVHGDDERRNAPPVMWRTGDRSTEPHLLALGQPGTGGTTLLRSIALQALQDGDVLVIDGGGTGEFACLAGRSGVMGVESGLSGALATLEWAAHETERRLIDTNRARQIGLNAPEDTRRPLWIIADRPTALAHVAAAEGREDPQRLLQVPLRHGPAANVTVVVADQFETAGMLSDAVRAHTKARIVLGPATAEVVRAVLGAPPHTTPTSEVPPGRGYARLGAGPVLRLQVPATPDPFDDGASEVHRRAVLELLPEPTVPAGEAAFTKPLTVASPLAVVQPAPTVEALVVDEPDADDGPAAEAPTDAEPMAATTRMSTVRAGQPFAVNGPAETTARAEG